jgi:phage tail-like protein
METLHEPVETVLHDLDRYLDPRLARPDFVPYLAGWVDLDWLLVAAPSEPLATTPSLASGLGTLRELVAAAAELARWRGTARGLLRFLDTATGTPGFAIEENVSGDQRQPRPFHLRVVAPAEAAVYRPLIERVIVAEKPAYATYELVFATGATPARATGRKGVSR